MKSFKLLSLVILFGLGKTTFTADEKYLSNFFNTFRVQQALETICAGNALTVLDEAEAAVDVCKALPRFAKSVLMITDGAERMHDIRTQGITIYGLGAGVFGGIGLLAAYQAYNTNGWKRKVTGTIGIMGTAVGALALHRALRLSNV